MGTVRKLLFPIVFFGVLLYALFHLMTHESFRLYREGMEHYRQEDYRQAHQLFVQAVDSYRYNQKALLMQRNSRFALMTLEVAETIEDFLEKSDAAIAEKDFDRVERLLESALLAIVEVRKRELGDLPRIDALEQQIYRKRDHARALARQHYIQQAQSYARAGELRLAYSYSEKIRPVDHEVQMLQSRLAMEIARRDITLLLTESEQNIAAHQVRFILFWLNKVHPDSVHFNEATRLKQNIEKLLQESTP
ncbi:hypothetical protein Selin_0140 [Desulfurispirillum indicum S5]|uniref:Uncharacterized protein n=1 Tax=Desulfurispirillum indicum (strain ATCC BAA-1389 / DSM 22839 / S5) TaxID=653733 RepID=E6W5G7_DESIS|nr:hypothetical protein [Desulfurispirillum indicum]ADU64898.1 hypothetical protein Selin_0140 [Desulfurispirillum indicum S5]